MISFWGGFCCILAVILFATGRRSSLPLSLASRSCNGRAWRNAFPLASSDGIRLFLGKVARSFDFPESQVLKLRPSDAILDIYREFYPYPWIPDELDLENLASELQHDHDLDLEQVWSETLTLGDVFDLIQIRQALDRGGL